jgi:hypothetical protein
VSLVLSVFYKENGQVSTCQVLKSNLFEPMMGDLD